MRQTLNSCMLGAVQGFLTAKSDEAKTFFNKATECFKKALREVSHLYSFH